MKTVVILALLALVPPALAALPDPVPVTAAGVSFVPAVLVVPAGTTVQWSAAAFPHTVTSAADVPGAATGVADGAYRSALPMGGAFSHTFSAPGTYTYFCELHYRTGMVGVVQVV